MYRYLVLFISPVVLLFGFWLFFYYGQGIIWLLVISILTIIISAKMLSRQYFWKFKTLWLNFIVVYVAELLFLLLLASETARYILSFILTLIWALIWWLVSRYFPSMGHINDKDYLAVNKFFYYLAFWFLSTSLYSFIIFLNLSLFWFLLVMLLAIFLWGRDIISSSEGLNKHYIWFVLFLSAQALLILYLLPVSFYITGTIATLWFFFIIDNTVSQIKHLRLYLSLFLGSIFILLISSLI